MKIKVNLGEIKVREFEAKNIELDIECSAQELIQLVETNSSSVEVKEPVKNNTPSIEIKKSMATDISEYIERIDNAKEFSEAMDILLEAHRKVPYDEYMKLESMVLEGNRHSIKNETDEILNRILGR